MNHAQLKAFHAVAETGGFSAAAKTLGLTQPAVTLQIQALEQTYNTKLFQRRGRKTEITASGKLLLEIARKMLRLEEEAHRLLSSIGTLDSGRLDVVASSSLSSLPLVAAFHAQYPGVRLSFMTASADMIETQLLDFRAHLAVHHAPPSDSRLFGIKIEEEPLKVAVSHKHPWSTKKSVTLRDLQDQILILPFTPANRNEARNHWSRLLQHDADKIIPLQSKEIGREAVANDLGITFLTETEIQWDSRIHSIEIEDESLKETTYVLGLKGERHTRLVSSFLELTGHNPGED
tara:strand:+ start:3130 stop:4002 length:873 start_codon:yes stop_codon:yes gene_type:complete